MSGSRPLTGIVRSYLDIHDFPRSDDIETNLQPVRRVGMANFRFVCYISSSLWWCLEVRRNFGAVVILQGRAESR